MLGAERLTTTMNGDCPDRVPVMPKIWVNTMSFVHSSPDELRVEALRCIEEGDRNGGFVLGSGCALPADSKRENLEALVAAAGG